MDRQVEEVKSKVDLVQLIGEHVSLKKAGRNFGGLCPFHTEKTPSFMVSPERQIWKCFGCGEGGDAFRFLMRIDGLDFGEALRVLAKRVGVRLVSFRPSGEEKVKQLLLEINHLAAEYFHYLLLNHRAGKKALDYVLGRGISRESLALFKLGYSPNRWDELQAFLVKKKGYRPEDLEKSGLIIKGNRGYYDRFRGRLMFVLKDHRGNVAGFAGRVLDPAVKEAKYVNTPETPVYRKSELLYGLTETKEAIRQADAAVLVEGELDLISSFQAGVKNVVAIKGSAVSEAQVRLLKRFTENLILALDQDAAGNLAALKGIEVAEAAGLSLKVVRVRGGKDPDEAAQKKPASWRKQVEGAIPVFDYLLAFALERHDANSADGKRKIVREFLNSLSRAESEVVKAHYLKRLAESLDLAEEVVLKEMDKVPQVREATRPVGKTAAGESETDRQERFEEHLLAMAFQSGRWPLLKKRAVRKLVRTPRLTGILEVLTDYFKRFKTCKSERLAKMMPAELIPAFNQLYLLDLATIIEDEERLLDEFQVTLERLEELELRQQLKALSLLIKKGERKEKTTPEERRALRAADEEFRDLSLRLKELLQPGVAKIKKAR